jgi:hypothetical protein
VGPELIPPASEGTVVGSSAAIEHSQISWGCNYGIPVAKSEGSWRIPTTTALQGGRGSLI